MGRRAMGRKGNGWLARAWRAREGNVVTLAALGFPVVLVTAALAVDEGSLYNERRALQGAADLAAISAASNPAKPEVAVLAALGDNGLAAALGDPASADAKAIVAAGGVIARVTGGRYTADAGVAPEARFQAGVKPFNAFQVSVARTGTRFFSEGLMGAPRMSASALGYAAPEAAFRVGTRLASLNGGVLNAVLGGLTGSALKLSVMDYRGLLDAQVDLLDAFDALNTSLKLKAATYDEVANASVALPDLLTALAGMPGRRAADAAALRQIAQGADKRLSVKLGTLFDPGAAGGWGLGARGGPVGASANLLDVVQAAAGVAQGGKQVSVALDAPVPGVMDASLTVAVGEREQGTPWMRVGERGTVVETAQTRIALSLRLPGPGGLLGNLLTLPLYAELAYATAELTDVACQTGRTVPSRASVSVRPGIARLSVGEVGATAFRDFRASPSVAKGTLVDAALVKIKGSAQASAGSANAATLSFNAKEIDTPVTKTAATTTPVSSLTASLLGTLSVEVQAGPLSLGVPLGAGAALSDALGAATKPVDALLDAVLTALGVSLGEADVTVSGSTCHRAVLVQ